MTEDRSPLDTALDLVLYAPVGLVLSVGEEVPKLATKGRQRVATQWATARMVGQFAVAQARREVQRRTGGASGASSPQAAVPEPAVAPTGAGAPAVAPVRPESDVPVVSGPRAPSSTNGAARDIAPSSPAASRSGLAVTTASRPEPPSAEPMAQADGPPDGPAPAPGPASLVEDLAIPGYDSLSASQVVQRLAGLAALELEAVGTYEAATRGRRTILARVSQLQGT